MKLPLHVSLGDKALEHFNEEYMRSTNTKWALLLTHFIPVTLLWIGLQLWAKYTHYNL
jgi:hypothetical protein